MKPVRVFIRSFLIGCDPSADAMARDYHSSLAVIRKITVEKK